MPSLRQDVAPKERPVVPTGGWGTLPVRRQEEAKHPINNYQRGHQNHWGIKTAVLIQCVQQVWPREMHSAHRLLYTARVMDPEIQLLHLIYSKPVLF